MSEIRYMQLALTLAAATKGQTGLNPCVGAVLVKNNKIIGFGSHIEYGNDHAEVAAINSAGNNTKDSILYVTLEPCCHFGKTPPCTKLIIEKKIKRVVVSLLDPNPLVNGKGIKELKDAGIDVVIGMLEKEARNLNTMLFHFFKTQTPYITLKAGMSLDGKLATYKKHSKWITNYNSRLDAHNYRSSHAAILVGINTIIADNPSLTTRLPQSSSPICIILDSKLRTPLNAKVFQQKERPVIIVTTNQASTTTIRKFQENNTQIIQMEDSNIDLKKLLPILAKNKIISILVEGGSKIHTSFIEAKLFNELVLYISPMLIGGKNAYPLFAGKGFFSIEKSLNLEFSSVTTIKDNIKIVAVPQKGI